MANNNLNPSSPEQPDDKVNGIISELKQFLSEIKTEKPASTSSENLQSHHESADIFGTRNTSPAPTLPPLSAEPPMPSVFTERPSPNGHGNGLSLEDEGENSKLPSDSEFWNGNVLGWDPASMPKDDSSIPYFKDEEPTSAVVEPSSPSVISKFETSAAPVPKFGPAMPSTPKLDPPAPAVPKFEPPLPKFEPPAPMPKFEPTPPPAPKLEPAVPQFEPSTPTIPRFEPPVEPMAPPPPPVFEPPMPSFFGQPQPEPLPPVPPREPETSVQSDVPLSIEQNATSQASSQTFLAREIFMPSLETPITPEAPTSLPMSSDFEQKPTSHKQEVHLDLHSPLPENVDSRINEKTKAGPLGVEKMDMKPENIVHAACIIPTSHKADGQYFFTRLRDMASKSKNKLDIEAVFIHEWTPNSIDMEAWEKSAVLSGADTMFIVISKNDLAKFSQIVAQSKNTLLKKHLVKVEQVKLQNLYAELVYQLSRKG